MSLTEKLQSSINRSLSGIYRNWSTTYIQRGDAEHAIQACNRALHLDPTMVDALVNRGLGYTQQGRLDEAIADFDRALEMTSPNDKVHSSNIHVNRGLAYYYHRDFGAAIVDYNMAIFMTPKESMIYVYRGLAEMAMDNPLGAIGDYNAAIFHAPDNVIAYRRRADAKVRLGNIKDALKDYWTFLEKGVMQSQQQRAEVESIVRSLSLQLQG